MSKFRMAFYKGTHPGLPGVYNRGVRAWTRGKYSHVEVVFSDGLSASASYVDGGVRFKKIGYTSDVWDFIELPAELEPAARAYFQKHEGEAYNLLGNVHFVIGLVPAASRKKFCSEAAGGSIGIDESWRFEPNALYVAVKRLVEVYAAQTVAEIPVAA